MPRTRIVDDQILDIDVITESELNEFFGTVVVTGTENSTQVVQGFSQYFLQKGIISAGPGVVVSTGTGVVTIGGSGALAPENFSYEVVTSGVIIAIPQYQQMVTH